MKWSVKYNAYVQMYRKAVQWWFDQRFQWNEKEFADIDSVDMLLNRIWLPKLLCSAVCVLRA